VQHLLKTPAKMKAHSEKDLLSKRRLIAGAQRVNNAAAKALLDTIMCRLCATSGPRGYSRAPPDLGFFISADGVTPAIRFAALSRSVQRKKVLRSADAAQRIATNGD
jgi:hypothetical protein